MPHLKVILSFLYTGVVCAAASAGDVPASAPEKITRDIPAASVENEQTPEKKALKNAAMLPPPGTLLKGVRYPNYKNDSLISYMTAPFAKMLEGRRILAQTVFIRLYRTDGSRMEATLDDALYHVDTGLLQSSKPVELKSPSFSAKGSKIVLNTTTNKGFLFGPVKTAFVLKDAAPSSPSTLKH